MRAGFLLFAALAFAQFAGAAEPALKQLYPLGGQQGTTVSVTATGAFDPWPPQFWADTPGLVFRAAKEMGKLTVEIAQDAAPGPHLVRLFNAQGASAPRLFFVSAEPEILEVEPNDDFKSPQKIEALPVTISGRLEKPGDVDSFAVTLKQGTPLTASVEAFVLGSPFDGMLRVVDPNGTQFAFNHDGRTLDPLLSWTAPRDGTYVVQLMGFAYPPGSNVNFVGNENCVYRLHLTAEAVPPVFFPPAGVPEKVESEPNDTAPEAGALSVPGAIAGAIQHDGDEDCFAFTAVKGTSYEVSLLAARAGSPLNGLLRIESPDGKTLAKEDGQGSGRDPKAIVWKAPADGRIIVVVGDLTHRGSKNHLYRLTVQEPVPSVSATAAIHSLVVPTDKGGELKVTVKRTNGFQAALQLAAKDLPAGVTAPEQDVPEKDGDVTLKFTVGEGAAPVSQPLHLVLREKEGGAEHPVRYLLPASGDKGDAAAGPSDLIIDSTETFWLTIPEKSAPAAPAKPEPPK
ncbi:MAG TPA: PPC domain-containing protein [Chthoniobacteraceae bacterium]|jgi:hypothetical protein|nr:PPC domain-containing protein [Chthoniobacteraceae bacterium]